MTDRTMYRGTVEYLTGSISADVEVSDADVLEVSLDRGASWLPTEWVGPEGVTRTWRILLGDTTPLPTAGSANVYLRITDNPEIPIVKAGRLQVQNL